MYSDVNEKCRTHIAAVPCSQIPLLMDKLSNSHTSPHHVKHTSCPFDSCIHNFMKVASLCIYYGYMTVV